MPYKRSIRLPNYDYSTDGAYFVTICTFQKTKNITGPYKKILKNELLGLLKRFKGLKIDFYVFMANHCHIIFILKNSPIALPKIIQAYKSISTRILKKSGYIGKFWQQNYYEHVIRDDKSLSRIREYIMNNPEKEKIDIDH